MKIDAFRKLDIVESEEGVVYCVIHVMQNATIITDASLRSRCVSHRRAEEYKERKDLTPSGLQITDERIPVMSLNKGDQFLYDHSTYTFCGIDSDLILWAWNENNSYMSQFSAELKALRA